MGYALRLSALENPTCNEGTVSHVSLLNISSLLDASELNKEARAKVAVVMCPGGLEGC